MAMGASLPSSELERMASELKCPICLSLYKQAASLSCNHCFCTSCILQSMKRISCCPVCKVPAAPREVRPAQQMDSLVTILKGMESSAGVSLFHTQQPSQLNSFDVGKRQLASKQQTGRKPLSSKGRKNKSRMTNYVTDSEIVKVSHHPKKRRRGKSDLARQDGTENGIAQKGVVELSLHSAVPTAEKKKVRASLPTLADGTENTEQNKASYACSKPHAMTSVPLEIANPVSSTDEEVNPIGNQGSGNLLVVDLNEAVALDDKEDQDLPHHTRVPIIDSSNQKPIQLSPFFWVGDRVVPSQDELSFQVTQTQGAARPVRPSFSDLKGSHDDDKDQADDIQQPDEGAETRLPEADSCDSDAFVWTQRPCSPELSSSPAKQVSKPKSLSRNEASWRGLEEDESRSSPKCRIEAPEEVEATQTPQLHQEPSRMIRGTLSKCSKSKPLHRGQSSGKVCRSLKSNDPSSLGKKDHKSLRRIKATRRKTRNMPTNSSLEGEICLETNLESRPDGVPLGNTGVVIVEHHCPPSQGFNDRDAMPACQQKDISGGEPAMPSGEPSCVFCRSGGDSEVAGPLVEYKDAFPSRGRTSIKAVHVHKLCAEWAPDVYFNEDEPKNLASEVTRGQKIKCSNCGMRGAALGCCSKRCKRSFHYPCGRATPGCKWDEDDFVMFCPQHADCKFPIRKRCRVSPGLSISEKDMTLKSFTQDATTGDRLQMWPPSPACKWVLCGSGLESQMKGELAAFASITGASKMKHWGPSVTHVITGTDEQGAAKRTLKFLMGMLQGKWIVKAEWMSACLAAGHIVGEDEYEVTSDTNGCTGGSKRSRALAAARGPKLLEGLSFYFFGEYSSVSKEDLQSLIVAGRGSVLHRKPLPVERSLSKCRANKVPQPGDTLVLYHGGDDRRKTFAVAGEVKSLAANAGAFAVPHTWLLDSVASCQLQPTSGREKNRMIRCPIQTPRL